MTRVVAFVPDLMDASKVRAAVDGVELVRSPAQLLEAGADADAVLLVDLGRLPDVAALGQLPARSIGFLSHVDDDGHRYAAAAGVDAVVARSRFFRVLAAGDIVGLLDEPPGR